LDENYTSSNPIQDGKPNILYLLHFHLNHPSNQLILPLLLEKMSLIQPYPAGQRLLKLLCQSFTDMNFYSELEKINQGAYGVIFSAKTGLSFPTEVAIK
jgi:hypothetical protein